MKNILLTVFAVFIGLISFSQQNPSSLKWNEINSEHAKIVFPAGLENQAQKVANLIDYLYPIETKTLTGKPKRLPLLLYNQSTVSNGFVGLRPWRSAWYVTPSQYAADLGSEDWFYTLGSHEFRHAVQYAKSNKHFTKLMSTFFGQTGILMGQYSYPYWYFEGDAVCMETGLSESGRGRIPQFEMGIRTILLNDKKISYDKAKFRSYKTFFPGHYNLGWLLTSYARENYGADIWNKTLESSSKYSFWPYAFSFALKHHTGLNEKKLYEHAMHDLDSAWTKKIENLAITDATIINPAKKKSWTKYTEPNFIDDNHILVKKSSMKSDITTFYMIDNDGKEYKIKSTDAGLVSLAKKKAVWARTYPDLRWQLRSYSDIIVFDIATKKEKRLTEKQKYFAPAISPDGNKIAVVEYTENMKSALVILDGKTGKEILRYPAKNNNFFRTPSWSTDNQRITFTRSNEKGTVLSIYDIETKTLKDVTERSFENIGRPVFYKNFIVYNTPYNGIGNIYAININTKKRFQITSRKFGAYNPKIKDNKMLFIDYSEEGYDIAELVLNETKWKPIEDVKYIGLNTAEILQKQEQNKNMMNPDLIPDKTFEVKKYNKLKHAVNIHSWGFYSEPISSISTEDILNYKPEVGFDIYSANILNTVFGSLGGSYNINEKTLSSNISAIFKRFYPEFSVSGVWAQRSVNYGDLGNDRWEEIKGTFKTSIPLNFSSGIYNKGARFDASYSYIQRKNKDYRYINESANDNFSSLKYTGQIYTFRHQATQDINPKFGCFLYALYQHTPFNTNIYGHQFSAIASGYLPGIFKHHSLNLKIGYEQQRSDINNFNYYWFSSPQTYPRGYSFNGFDQITTYQINYSFPVWYPDINIGPFVYFKRLRANVFYDYANSDDIYMNQYGDFFTYLTKYQSAGLELFLQIYVLRLQEPIEIGGRISYILSRNPLKE
ncbi:MAG: PD40 domain-containing protein, partial [Bacteroidales bacterium]|nr:PD40 domain-containing protein [Bacteroidales bacterium]